MAEHKTEEQLGEGAGPGAWCVETKTVERGENGVAGHDRRANDSDRISIRRTPDHNTGRKQER